MRQLLWNFASKKRYGVWSRRDKFLLISLFAKKNPKNSFCKALNYLHRLCVCVCVCDKCRHRERQRCEYIQGETNNLEKPTRRNLIGIKLSSSNCNICVVVEERGQKKNKKNTGTGSFEIKRGKFAIFLSKILFKKFLSTIPKVLEFTKWQTRIISQLTTLKNNYFKLKNKNFMLNYCLLLYLKIFSRLK